MEPTASENNVPLLPQRLSRHDIWNEIHARVHRIDREFTLAFEFIKKYDHSVSFFGSARFADDSDHYQKARALAKRIATELDCTILTGGGGGIMEAANRGALEAGKQSVGLNIRLPKGQQLNSYTTDSIELNYFFVRKTALSFAAEAYIFFPGGFGTMDEFFELVTLIQTQKIRRIPIILVGADYWNRLNDFIEGVLYKEHRAVSEGDMKLYYITDSEDEILHLIKKSPAGRYIE